MRSAFVIAAITLLTLALLPFQIIGLFFDIPLQRTIPHLYHRALCKLIGVRIHQIGHRSKDAPTLYLSNHVSWLDICVISALTPVVFVSKSEVAKWPVFGWLARLQRTIFIDRQARQQTAVATGAIGDRLRGGENVVLFAEGTSSDGTRILPFRSALIGGLHRALAGPSHPKAINVQPVSLAYVAFNGLPVGRAFRDRIAWYGSTELIPHLIGLVSAGAVDVTVSWGDPGPTDINFDRKQVARDAERSVRQMTAAARVARPVLS